MFNPDAILICSKSYVLFNNHSVFYNTSVQYFQGIYIHMKISNVILCVYKKPEVGILFYCIHILTSKLFKTIQKIFDVYLVLIIFHFICKTELNFYVESANRGIIRIIPFKIYLLIYLMKLFWRCDQNSRRLIFQSLI